MGNPLRSEAQSGTAATVSRAVSPNPEIPRIKYEIVRAGRELEARRPADANALGRNVDTPCRVPLWRGGEGLVSCARGFLGVTCPAGIFSSKGGWLGWFGEAFRNGARWYRCVTDDPHGRAGSSSRAVETGRSGAPEGAPLTAVGHSLV
jgi:hypothetical protein